jgi:hypothetical protein
VAWARGVFKPLEKLSATIRRVGAAFDEFLDNLAAHCMELQRWGEELNRKVAERSYEQTHRIWLIVTKLLQFARPGRLLNGATAQRSPPRGRPDRAGICGALGHLIGAQTRDSPEEEHWTKDCIIRPLTAGQPLGFDHSAKPF